MLRYFSLDTICSSKVTALFSKQIMSADKYFARFPRLFHWAQKVNSASQNLRPFHTLFRFDQVEWRILYKAVIPVVLFGLAMNRTSSDVTRLVRSFSTRVQFGLSNNFYINKDYFSKKKLSFNFPVGHFRLTSRNLYNTSAFREVKLEWESPQCAISQRIV